MRPFFFISAGAFLMAACGSVLGRKIGLEGVDMAWIAGFAVGVVMLGQFPAIALRKRIALLEERNARASVKSSD